MGFENNRGEMRRIHPALVERIKQFQLQQAAQYRRNCTFTEASKMYAETSFTSKDNVMSALRRLGKHQL